MPFNKETETRTFWSYNGNEIILIINNYANDLNSVRETNIPEHTEETSLENWQSMIYCDFEIETDQPTRS